jgi:hypothetical protein
MPLKPIQIVYCSWSKFKKEEWNVAKTAIDLDVRPGCVLGQLFDVEFRNVPLPSRYFAIWKVWSALRSSRRIELFVFLA